MHRLLAFALLLTSGAVLAQSSATYRVTLDATWSAQTHPSAFPGNPHFSPLVGAVHNGSVKLWEAGTTASPGMEQMAETGGTSMLRNEINAVGGNAVLAQVNGGGIGLSPGAVSTTFTATESHSLVSLVTMIAPSPDWFVGTESVDMLDASGDWQAEVVVPMYAWDAGTDSGTGYTSSNADTNPQEPIARIEASPFVVGGTLTPLGTMTFTLLSVVSNEQTPEASTSLRVMPQPLVASGEIQVETEATGDVSITLFDVRGRKVRTLHRGPLASGAMTIPLDARGFAPGVYMLRMDADDSVTTQRVIIAR